MGFDIVTEMIRRELEKPLPGKAVQLLMSSLHRIREILDFSNNNTATKSSVLILLYPENGETKFVVTQRPEYDGIHSGQISLPGGRFEMTDSDLKETALRETFEEIGVDPSKITILGKLTELYIPPSNYIVQPFVGVITEKPDFLPHPKEVKEIYEISLDELLDSKNRQKKKIKVRGMKIMAPCYVIRNITIWGATAMILSEFREVTERAFRQL